MTNEVLHHPESPNAEATNNFHLASLYHQLLVKRFNQFNLALDDNHETGIKVFNGGQNLQFHLTGIMHADPSLISFQGVTVQGSPIEVLQHVSQVNIILVTLPRLNMDKPKQVFEFTQ